MVKLIKISLMAVQYFKDNAEAYGLQTGVVSRARARPLQTKVGA